MSNTGMRDVGEMERWNKVKDIRFILFVCLFVFVPSLLNSDSIAEEKQRKSLSIGVNWPPASRSVCSESYWKIPPSIWLRTRHFSRVVENSPEALVQSHQCLCHANIHLWKSQTVTGRCGTFASEHLEAQRNPTPSRI